MDGMSPSAYMKDFNVDLVEHVSSITLSPVWNHQMIWGELQEHANKQYPFL